MQHFCRLFILFSALLISFSPTFLQAATYYVSADGDDNNDGLSEATPWQTFANLADAMVDDTTVLFRRGDVFRGKIKPVRSPVGLVFSDYGDANKAAPVIAGSVVITNWQPTTHSSLPSQVYEADVSAFIEKDDEGNDDNSIQYLFVNGEMMTIARYPNVDSPKDKNWLEVDKEATDVLISSELDAYNKPQNYWQGATLRIRNYSWTYKVFSIRSSSGSRLIPREEEGLTLGTQLPGWGFFIDDKLEELDHPGEWYYDADTKKVYFYPKNGVNPNNVLVEGMTYATGINSPGENSVIENLTFRHFTTAAIRLIQDNNATIRNSTFEDNTQGIYSWSQRNANINNNVFKDSMENGMILWGEGVDETNVAENNVVQDNGMYIGYGVRYSGVYQGIGIGLYGTGNTVRKNVIENSSHAGITLFGGGNHIVENNVVRNSLLLLNDGGNIVIHSDANKIRGNFVLNAHGNVDKSNGCATTTRDPCYHHPSYGTGIFSDSKFENNVIENNTAANNEYIGIYLNAFTNTEVKNNVSYNNDPQLRLTDGLGPSRNNNIEGNTLVALHPEKVAMELSNDTDHGSYQGNTYCNPYNNLVIIRDNYYYSFPHWDKATRDDSNSRGCPFSFKAYNTTEVSENMLINSNLDVDTENWAPPQSISHDTTQTALDGGSLKVDARNLDSNLNISPYGGLSIKEGHWYRLAFSAIADGYADLRITTVSKEPEYEILERHFVGLTEERKDYEYVFQASKTTDSFDFLLTLDGKDDDVDTYWLDNISLHEVTLADSMPATERVKLFMNPTETEQTISFEGVSYYDLQGNPVSGSGITLAPFTSEVLVRTDDDYTPEPPPPAGDQLAAPQLNVDQDGNFFQFTWDRIEGANSYLGYAIIYPSNRLLFFLLGDSDHVSVALNQVESGLTYHLGLIAYNTETSAFGPSSNLVTVKEPPLSNPLATPTLTAEVVEGNNVNLSWSEVPEAEGYHIYFFLPALNQGVDALVNNSYFRHTPVENTTSTVVPLDTGSVYYIVALAYNSTDARQSEASNPELVTVP